MNKIKLLLVEDETTLAMIVKDTLEGEGFEVVSATDGLEGMEMIPIVQPDIIVADIMMPRMDGFDMVRRIRRTDKDTPILFLTARSNIEDLVEGFNIGGNDYLRKPFSMMELIVRVKALLQRHPKTEHPMPQNENIVLIGRYTLNTTTQLLKYDQQIEELSHRESEILRILATHKDLVVSSQEILLTLWGDDNMYNARSLQVFITKLRHRLTADPSVKIINVRGIGYKLIF